MRIEDLPKMMRLEAGYIRYYRVINRTILEHTDVTPMESQEMEYGNCTRKPDTCLILCEWQHLAICPSLVVSRRCS
jgi:hypothetical protein